MENLIESVLQDAVLVSVRGNGEVCAQCVQMICIVRMYREACIYSKGSYRVYYMYAGRRKNAWPDLQGTNL